MSNRLTPETLAKLRKPRARARKCSVQRLLLQQPQAFGDCRCGHSVAYHLPLVGCMKCDCDEFR